MNYIIYADVMIFWNFIINIISIYISSKILQINIKATKIIIWSLITSILTVITYIVCYNNILLPVFYALMYIFMIIMYFKINSLKDLLIKISTLIISMLLIYGVINLSKGGEHNNIIFNIIYIFVFFFVFNLINKVISHKFSGKYYKVKLKHHNSEIYANGYKDTGNTLKDLYTHEPVIIIDYRLMKKILNPKAYQYIISYHENGYMDYEHINQITDFNLYPIPYSTISSNFELLPAFKVNNLLFINENKLLRNVITGISRFKLKNDFQILLNEDLKI